MQLTFRQYFSKLAIIAACYLIIPLGFGWCATASTLISFVGSAACFLSLTVVSVFLLFPDHRTRRFYVVSFFVLLIIGVLHYLLFVDSLYFSGHGTPDPLFWHEYQTTFDSLEKLVYGKLDNGLFYVIPKEEYATTHIELYNIISMPFVSLGVKWLNFTPFNAFCTLLTSMNLLLFSKWRGSSEYVQALVMYCVAFFPILILCDNIWRDPCGVALISCACILCMLSELKGVRFIFSLLLLLYCGYILRIMYPVVILCGYGLFWLKRTSAGALKYIVVLVFEIIGVLLFNSISGENEGYTEGYTGGVSVMSLPIQFMFEVIGAFPWSNFLMYKLIPAAAYYPSEYLGCIFNIACIWAVVKNIKIMKFTESDLITFVGLGIMIAGVVSNASHMGYLTEGLIFALPFLFDYVGAEFTKYLRYSFVILLFANIVVILMGGNLGLSTLLR